MLHQQIAIANPKIVEMIEEARQYSNEKIQSQEDTESTEQKYTTIVEHLVEVKDPISEKKIFENEPIEVLNTLALTCKNTFYEAVFNNFNEEKLLTLLDISSIGIQLIQRLQNADSSDKTKKYLVDFYCFRLSSQIALDLPINPMDHLYIMEFGDAKQKEFVEMVLPNKKFKAAFSSSPSLDSKPLESSLSETQKNHRFISNLYQEFSAAESLLKNIGSFDKNKIEELYEKLCQSLDKVRSLTQDLPQNKNRSRAICESTFTKTLLDIYYYSKKFGDSELNKKLIKKIKETNKYALKHLPNILVPLLQRLMYFNIIENDTSEDALADSIGNNEKLQNELKTSPIGMKSDLNASFTQEFILKPYHTKIKKHIENKAYKQAIQHCTRYIRLATRIAPFLPTAEDADKIKENINEISSILKQVESMIKPTVESKSSSQDVQKPKQQNTPREIENERENELARKKKQEAAEAKHQEVIKHKKEKQAAQKAIKREKREKLAAEQAEREKEREEARLAREKQKEEEARKAEELARKQKEEEARKAEELARKQKEEEARKAEELARKQKEEEARKNEPIKRLPSKSWPKQKTPDSKTPLTHIAIAKKLRQAPPVQSPAREHNPAPNHQADNKINEYPFQVHVEGIQNPCYYSTTPAVQPIPGQAFYPTYVMPPPVPMYIDISNQPVILQHSPMMPPGEPFMLPAGTAFMPQFAGEPLMMQTTQPFMMPSNPYTSEFNQMFLAQQQQLILITGQNQRLIELLSQQNSASSSGPSGMFSQIHSRRREPNHTYGPPKPKTNGKSS